MFTVAARILVFAVVFLGLNPLTVVVFFGVNRRKSCNGDFL